MNKGEEIMNVWTFIQNELLGMNYLNEAIGKMLQKSGVDISGR